MKVWITAYALTKGILECETKDVSVSARDKMVVVKWNGGINNSAMFHGNDWHLNLESAQNRVSVMIEAKRKSMRKAIRKLDEAENNGTAYAVKKV